jgi:hypothetical protein
MGNNVNTSLDYCLAAGVVVEAGVLYILLTQQVSLLGYILPGIVALVSTGITIASFRDFSQHIKKK